MSRLNEKEPTIFALTDFWKYLLQTPTHVKSVKIKKIKLTFFVESNFVDFSWVLLNSN